MKTAEEYLNDSINMPGMQPLYEHGNVINMINQARIDALTEANKRIQELYFQGPVGRSDIRTEIKELIDEIK